MKTPIVVVLAVSPLVVACAPDPEQERLERAIGAEYNEETGRLELLTYDSNDNGTVDVWTYMDGTAVLRAEVDANEGSSAESVGETGAKPAAIAPPADHGARPRQGSPRTLGGCAALDTRCAPRSRHESAMDERGLRRAVQAMLERGASPEDLRTEVNRIRLALNPHPAGQLTHNVPTLERGGRFRACSTGAPDPGCRVRGSEPRKNGRLKRS